jgi:hypothetical protein
MAPTSPTPALATPTTPATPSKGNTTDTSYTSTTSSTIGSSQPTNKDSQPAQIKTSVVHSGSDSTGKPAPAHGSSNVPLPAATQTSEDSSLDPFVQAKIVQSEMVASTILSYLDWDGKHPATKAPFTPFSFFCPDSLLSVTEKYLQEHLQGPIAATQMAKDGSTIQGTVWKVYDQSKADGLKAYVQNLKPGAQLGVDMYTVNGQMLPGRVIDGF